MITVSQVLGTAAMLDGYVVRGLDQTGLSQKAGPVVSDLRLSRGDVPASNHANSSGVDCLLAFDLLVAASDTHRVGADTSRTIVVGSVASTPTGAMVAHPTTPYPELGRAHRPPRRGVARRPQPLRRLRGARHRAVRRLHDGQHPAARRRRAGRRRRRRPAADRAGDRAQRRRRRPQRRRLPLGPALGGVPGRGRAGRRHRRGRRRRRRPTS